MCFDEDEVVAFAVAVTEFGDVSTVFDVVNDTVSSNAFAVTAFLPTVVVMDVEAAVALAIVVIRVMVYTVLNVGIAAAIIGAFLYFNAHLASDTA